jgi:hypothetical protein
MQEGIRAMEGEYEVAGDVRRFLSLLLRPADSNNGNPKKKICKV